MKKTIGKIGSPSVFGTQGGATTLLYVVLIVALWLSITGRTAAVRAALQGANGSAPASGTNPIIVTPDQLPSIASPTGNGTIDDWLKAHGQLPRTLPPGGIGH